MAEEDVILQEQLDTNFKYEVSREPGGERLKSCYACGTCTASCPVRFVNEKYDIRKIIRMVLLGLKKEVLSSDFIWLCAACYTCSERCPQDVRITDLMRAIKNIAVREGYVPDWLKKQVELLKTAGKLLEIDEFENERRQKLNLPPMKTSQRTKEDLKTIFELV